MKKQALILLKAAGLIAGMCLISVALFAQASRVSASNISRYVGNRRWDWTIFIKASTEVLENIKCVEYTLHPTFPNPVRKVCSLGDSSYPFGLTYNGKGVFEISIKVIFKNRKIHFLKHMLKFEMLQVKDRLPITADNQATYLGNGQWDWKVFITGPVKVLDRIQLVKYTLHPTFSDPEQEVFDRGKGRRGFALSAIGWGVFKINIRVFFKNGRIQDLEHDLRF